MAIQSAYTLNSNEIFASLANMIISQEVFADNLSKHQTLVDKARVDGSMYGDKKLYTATDVLSTNEWGNDSEAANLLSLDRPDNPEVQAITLDVFRQIRLTIDYYLSKRAWMDAGAFSSFTSVMLGWMRETKKVYDGTHYNVFIGTTETTVGEQDQTVSIANNATPETEAKLIAQKIADLIVDMGDYTRDYNDYGYLRSYTDDKIKVVWNSYFLNKIKKVDLPAIFHKEGLVDKMDSEYMPPKYFGRAINTSTEVGENKLIGADGIVDTTQGTVRSKVEFTVNVAAAGGRPARRERHFPGDILPSGAKVVANVSEDIDDLEFGYDSVYVEDKTVIAKVLVKLPPYMSAFEVGTSFFNRKISYRKSLFDLWPQYIDLSEELSFHYTERNNYRIIFKGQLKNCSFLKDWRFNV